MSLHKCPNCKEIRFNWIVDNEISDLTIWDCWECNYTAYEDESKESNCPECKFPFRIFLKDDNSKYWWCSECERKVIIE